METADSDCGWLKMMVVRRGSLRRSSRNCCRLAEHVEKTGKGVSGIRKVAGGRSGSTTITSNRVENNGGVGVDMGDRGENGKGSISTSGRSRGQPRRTRFDSRGRGRPNGIRVLFSNRYVVR